MALFEKVMKKVAEEQNRGSFERCPRCGGPMNEELLRNALSRYADVYICDECGAVEAVCNMMGVKKPEEEWAAMYAVEFANCR